MFFIGSRVRCRLESRRSLPELQNSAVRGTLLGAGFPDNRTRLLLPRQVFPVPSILALTPFEHSRAHSDRCGGFCSRKSSHDLPRPAALELELRL
jgi:hypothetical protein